MRRLLPFALGLCMLLWAAPAQAATGDLTFKDCLAKFAIGTPCSAVPNEVLEGGRDVAVSPDGRFVYVADYVDSVVVFKRSLATGAISFASCIDNGGDTGCTHLPNNTLLAPRRLALAPDGSSLYVAAETSDAIVRLSVAADGSLSFAGCVEDDDMFNSGCGQKTGTLDGPTRVVVSPDGTSVYSVSNDWSLNHFSATLVAQGCYREVTEAGCATQAEPLQAASGLAISPDEKFLYATSVGQDAIAWFKREASGALTFVGCTADGEGETQFIDNCSKDTGVNYNYLNHITLSPDGSSAYVTDETGLGAVYHFSRNALTGALTRQDCLADSLGDAPGCTELNNTDGSGLSSVTDAVVSPDAANLYTVAPQDSALSTFGLTSPSGTMSFVRCLRANEVVVQGCAPFNSSTLEGPFGVDVSPDGHDVYVANGNGVPALLHFEREAPGTRPGEEPEEPGPEEPGPEGPGPGTGTGGSGSGSGSSSPPPVKLLPNPPPPTPGVKCGGFKATKVGTPRADTIKGTPRKDVIAAGAGNDKVSALGGKDIVCGEGGNDQLGGGPGGDLLLGGPGRDTLLGNGGVDRFVGGPGRDSVKQ